MVLAQPDNPERTRPKVLYVDDEPELRAAFRRSMGRRGFDVEVAPNVLDAIAMARRNDYAVIATDLCMPGLDGMSLVEHLKHSHPDTTFLLVTGSSALNLPSTGATAENIVSLIRKPWDDGELAEMLSRATRLRRPGAITQRANDRTVRMMLIDPDVASVKRLTALLGDGRHEVVSADRIETALRRLAIESVDVIATVLALPDSRGLSTVTRLRDVAPTLPILVLTTNSSRTSLELQAVELGAQDCLAKQDLSADKLHRAIDYAIRRKRSEQKLRAVRASAPPPSGTGPAAAESELTIELRRAIENSEFALSYQPQFSLKSSSMVGVEALLRWERAAGPRVGPDRFIPELERSGDIAAVGAWVLETACRQLKIWQRSGNVIPRVAVNVSPRELDDPMFVERVKSTLSEQGIEPARVELEITESAVVRAPEAVKPALETLRDLGVRIALDDFGTGYSSFATLSRLPFTTLKIDKSLIGDLGSFGKSAEVTRGIIDLGHRLQLEVVAEGVEYDDQLSFLYSAGCDVIQGHLCGRPASPSSFTRMQYALTPAGGTPIASTVRPRSGG
jgi:EAL domain-containing protein (putative c-di-GMP-specific phosphodiesterase class I)/CheY-like chemotaxis protein